MRYHDAILESIISTGAADDVITALSDIIKRLAVDKLHIVGDIFRPRPRACAAARCAHGASEYRHSVGATTIFCGLAPASGSPACIFTVLRISLDYGNANLLERRYGISLQPLYDFTRKYYGEGNEEKRQYRVEHHRLQKSLKAGSSFATPATGMNSRLMLNRCDFGKTTRSYSMMECIP